MSGKLHIPALAIVYAAVAAASIWLSAESSSLAALWLPNAVAFILGFRLRQIRLSSNLLALAIGICLANLAFGMHAAASVLLAAANAVEVFASVTITKWLLTYAAGVSKAIRAGLIVVAVGALAPLIGATIGATILHFQLAMPFAFSWLAWFSGSMLGAIIVLPIGLALNREELRSLLSVGAMGKMIAALLVAAIVPVLAINAMRFPFVAVAIPIALSAATLTQFQTALVAATAVLSVYFNSFVFLGQIEDGYYGVEITAAAALAAVPAVLFSVLREELRQSQAQLEESETLFRTAMDNSAIGMAIVDNQGQINKANPRFGQHLGYPPDELAGIDFRKITHPDDLAIDEAEFRDLLSGERDRYEIEKRYITKDGKPVWGLLAVSIIRSTRGGPDFFVSQIVDIDDRKRYEETLHDLNSRLSDEKERLRITLYSIGDAVITTDRWTCVTFMNPVAERLTGWSRQEAENRPLSEIFRLQMESTGEHVPSPVDECLKRGQPYYLHDGVALIARNGKMISIQDSAAPVRGPDGVIHGAVLIFQDVSSARSLQRQLLHSAMHDALTDLPNRRAFEQRLADACVDVSGRIASHVVGYMDLDRFKLINDTAGHAAGDAALKEVSRLLKSMLRADDVVARIGGDEFGLILLNCSVEKAAEIGEKLVTAIRASAFHWNGRVYEVGASIGLAEISGGRRDSSELLVQADIACYAAKTAGRNRVFAYHGEQHDVLQHRRDMDIATTLKTAIEQSRFRLFAQELVSFEPDDPVERRFEIFVRLIGENGEYVAPSQFIPAAERYNMMASIDKWVIAEALATCADHLQKNPSHRISINISVDSMNDESLAPFISETIASADIRADQICFEITETAVMSNAAAAIEFVTSMQEIGAKIALDDFGAGMSSFAYLKLFKADAIKIDASFVRDLTRSKGDREIISAIVGLSRALGIRTVAEGIETSEQLEVVRDLGVSIGQGYHFGRPGPVEVVMDLPTQYAKQA